MGLTSNGRKRVALLGTGVIASAHMTALRAASDIVEVVAACDLDERKVVAFQQEYRIPVIFQNLDEMLDRISPDVVHVLLPPEAHARAAETCLAAGSHVFVEKPFCVTASECRRVEAAAARAGLSIGVNHNLAFMPTMLEVIKIIRSCRLGRIEHVRVIYNLPMPGLSRGPHAHWMFSTTGRIMLELGPHPVSIVCRLLGPVKATAALASGEMMLSNGVRFFRNWQSSLECERGPAQCVLTVGAGFYSASAHVIGEDGEIFADLRRNTLQFSAKSPLIRTGDLVDGLANAGRLAGASVRNFVSYGLGTVRLRPRYSLQNMSIASSIGAFYESLRAGLPPLVGGAQGTAVVDACEQIIESGLASAEKRQGELLAARG